MLALFDAPGGGPEVLLPGHGFPVVGADRVRQALADTAVLLESLVDQTLALMNAGARLDEVIHTVAPPPELMERPYLRPVYDEPEFIVHTVWRQYGGWWDGNPATLKPARERALATELAELAGGAGTLADRALALLDGGRRRDDRAGAEAPAAPGGPPGRAGLAGRARRPGHRRGPTGRVPRRADRPPPPWPTGCSPGRPGSPLAPRPASPPRAHGGPPAARPDQGFPRHPARRSQLLIALHRPLVSSP